MAGARLVEDVLARGGAERFETVMFGNEPYGNYNRILLSSVLAGSHDPKDIFINPLAWYDQNRIKLHAGRRSRADRPRRPHRARGRRRRRALRPPGDRHRERALRAAARRASKSADGAWKPGAFVFRTLDDCAAITAYASGARKDAAVIGGGLLGLEAARGLLNQGLEVHVVHLMPHLMEVQLDPAAGSILGRTLEAMGVHVHVEKSTTGVLGDERVTGLAFKDGSTLDCDMVVISAGIRPNVALAREAGLTVERGMVVGDDITSPDDPRVHAVGECAQHRGKVYGLVAPLWEQTRVLADRLTGRKPDAVYEGSRVSTKLKVMGVELSVMGAKEPATRVGRGRDLLRPRARASTRR